MTIRTLYKLLQITNRINNSKLKSHRDDVISFGFPIWEIYSDLKTATSSLE